MTYETAARGAVRALRLPKADTDYVFFNLSIHCQSRTVVCFSHSQKKYNIGYTLLSKLKL